MTQNDESKIDSSHSTTNQSQPWATALRDALLATENAKLMTLQTSLRSIEKAQSVLKSQLADPSWLAPMLEQSRQSQIIAKSFSAQSLKPLHSAMEQVSSFQKSLVANDEFIKLVEQIKEYSKTANLQAPRLDENLNITDAESAEDPLSVLASNSEVLRLAEEIESENPNLANDFAKDFAPIEGISWDSLTPSQRHDAVNLSMILVANVVFILLSTAPLLAAPWIAVLMALYVSQISQIEKSAREIEK